jgi:hypothetical protein
MKTRIAALVLVTVAAAPARAAERTLVGVISDSMCKVSHAAMPKQLPNRECAQDCASKGAQYVLLSEGKIYKLSNHDSDLKAHAGHTVNLTGDVKGDTIRVSRIDMPKDGTH